MSVCVFMSRNKLVNAPPVVLDRFLSESIFRLYSMILVFTHPKSRTVTHLGSKGAFSPAG